jgi:pre-mRNA-splicing factor 38A
MDKILRQRVEESLYYKQRCFGLNAATLLDVAIELNAVGSLDIGNRPMPFASLLTKLFELRPTREIVEFYISQPRFKYLKLLALLYHRLVFRDYAYLVSLVDEDYRKVRVYSQGEFSLSYMDECVDALAQRGEFAGYTLVEMDRQS